MNSCCGFRREAVLSITRLTIGLPRNESTVAMLVDIGQFLLLYGHRRCNVMSARDH